MSTAIRRLRKDDAPVISSAFARMGWTKHVCQYERYFCKQQTGQIIVLVAEVENRFAGYLKIVWKPEYPPFREQGVPEIQDLNVLLEYRRRGVASTLMDEAEDMVARRSAQVGIGVGLHPGYNAAQRMYVLRGYVPDGRGVVWRGEFISEGQTVIADDELVLYLTKMLK